MKSVFNFILGLILCISANVNAKEYIFENVTSNAGITFNAISKLAEDKNGFIWFCCTNGLYNYNSSEIKKFDFDQSKPNAPISEQVRYIYRDRKGKLWICTDRDICLYNENKNAFERLNFKNEDSLIQLQSLLLKQVASNLFITLIQGQLYSFNPAEVTLNNVVLENQSSPVRYFNTDKKGNVYVAIANGTIFKGDSLLTSFTPVYQTNTGSILTLSVIDNDIWIGYDDHGVEVINSNGELLKHFAKELKGKQHIISNRVRKIVGCANGDVWIGTMEGLSILSKDGNRHILPNRQNGLPHEGIFDLLVDRSDGVWVATWSGGLAYYNKFNYKFPLYQGTKNESTWNSVISTFAEQNNTILVGSENHGLYKYTPANNKYEKVKGFPVGRIKALKTDYKNRLWIATLYEGLWVKENNNLKRIGKIKGIYSTVLATKQGVWIGTRNDGAIFYDEKKNTFQTFKRNSNQPDAISSNAIWTIFEDSKGNLWFSSDFGISVRYKNDNYFTNYFSSENENSLSSNSNYTIAEDKFGKIWIGSAGKGIDIFNPKSKTFEKFRFNSEINDADIYCILRDKNDNMWFSSNHGIFAYYSDTQTLKNFTKEDGLLGQQYHPNSGFISKNGNLFFGGGNGFNIINPAIVQPNTFEPKIFLSKLTINNQNIDKQKPKYINSEYISAINQIELNYKQNTIGVAFIANTFIKNSKSKFRYRLLNYIDEWNVSDYNSTISFTKIPPGDYVLQVEYLNSDGLNKASLKEINISINPPFWLSWYAYLIYSVLIITILFIALREIRFHQKSKIEHILFTEKVKFFTNVSHEFRTPLTLIISPINSLLKKYGKEPKTIDNLKIIQRNADRLLRLTNQLLDFRLIEINNVKLKRDKVDIITLCKNVYDCFEFQIQEKEINYIFNSSFKSFELFVDAEKIEKVVYNILSNAVKYSEEKGQIILSIEQKLLTDESYSKVFSTGNKFIGDVLEIKIKDNGKGIKKSILNRIFERFFVDAENTQIGTGIGLHICQEYMRLHNGNIMVDSEPEKETTFTINIPIESEAKFEKESIILQSYFDHNVEQNDNVTETDSNIKQVILFAEDNNELRMYYKKLLSSKYKVISAKNGSQAFEIASELIPNLIISDILMPGIDGMSLTEKIRNTKELKHIPIILLTALSDNKSRIESMRKGANEFLTKPVEEELLFAKINNILSNAEIVKSKYKDEVNSASNSINSNQFFIEKVEKIVEENLQNPLFEITQLANQIGTSRSSLQRKIKKMVNMSPSEFIREVRLRKAVNLLKSTDYNIDEIAIIVGFNSTSYFIRSFKSKYEMTPTAFKNSVKNNQRINPE